MLNRSSSASFDPPTFSMNKPSGSHMHDGQNGPLNPFVVTPPPHNVSFVVDGVGAQADVLQPKDDEIPGYVSASRL
jgi:hypothetical protein